MNEEIIHRKAKFGHTLCGKSVPNDKTTLDDASVTCEECKNILSQLAASAMMKTSIIRKFVDSSDDDDDENELDGGEINEHKH